MNIYFYIMLFIIGTVFGSFYTLAVYRIPKNIDIIKKHSYCPNCNHKLGFFELIPILSYIFLGGKCNNCKQKIRIRYLLLEVLSGIAFVVLGIVLKIDIYNFDIQKIIIYSLIVLYLTAIIIIAGIDKEYIKIDRRVLAYGIIISIIYMIYLYTVEQTNIYRYAIYLVIYIAFLSIDTYFLRKRATDSYAVGILTLLNMILIFVGLKGFIITIVATLFSILIYWLIEKMIHKKRIKLKNIPIGFFICTISIISLYTVLFMTNYHI